jgi:hypothetical protein
VKQFLVAILATVTCALVACDDPGARTSPSPPRSPPPSPVATAAEPSPPGALHTAHALVLGPHGVASLRLGMTYRDVADTGTARALPGSSEDGWSRGCRMLFYRPERLGRTPGNTQNGTVSPGQGLEQLYATRRMATPEGIHIGSTLQDVRAAYDLPGVSDGDEVTVRASRRAVYRIQLDGVVTSIALELRRRDCTR